eukprot:12868935-Alexandrium_andersonii.AAC.1
MRLSCPDWMHASGLPHLHDAQPPVHADPCLSNPVKARHARSQGYPTPRTSPSTSLTGMHPHVVFIASWRRWEPAH